MTTLLHNPAPVHADWNLDREPWDGPGDEPFAPTKAQEAYAVAYAAARSGEQPAIDLPEYLGRSWEPAMLQWARGRLEGRRAFEADQARQLGEAVAWLTPISEPPPGFAAHEQAAYRVGFAAGTALAEAEAREDAWLASLNEQALADHFRVELSDADVYSGGAC